MALSLRSTAESSLSEHFLPLHQFLFFLAATKNKTFHYSPEAMSDAFEQTSHSWCSALAQITRPVAVSSRPILSDGLASPLSTLCGPKTQWLILPRRRKTTQGVEKYTKSLRNSAGVAKVSSVVPQPVPLPLFLLHAATFGAIIRSKTSRESLLRFHVKSTLPKRLSSALQVFVPLTHNTLLSRRHSLFGHDNVIEEKGGTLGHWMV